MEKEKPTTGTVAWTDLTTGIANQLREFYQNVLGWTSEGIPMKDGEDAYQDYVMKSPDGKSVAGICHLRGLNTGIPPQWIIYITVDNVQEATQKAFQAGGEILKEYRDKEGNLNYAMIQDPAGAVFGIAQTQN